MVLISRRTNQELNETDFSMNVLRAVHVLNNTDGRRPRDKKVGFLIPNQKGHDKAFVEVLGVKEIPGSTLDILRGFIKVEKIGLLTDRDGVELELRPAETAKKLRRS